jgi:hypothetical protein
VPSDPRRNAPDPLIALVAAGKPKKSRPHPLYAKAAQDPECDDADERDVPANQSTKDRLTLKTVAIVWRSIGSSDSRLVEMSREPP